MGDLRVLAMLVVDAQKAERSLSILLQVDGQWQLC